MSNRNDVIEEEIGQLVERLEELSVEQKLVTKKLKNLQGVLKGRRASQSSRVRKSSSSTTILQLNITSDILGSRTSQVKPISKESFRRKRISCE